MQRIAAFIIFMMILSACKTIRPNTIKYTFHTNSYYIQNEKTAVSIADSLQPKKTGKCLNCPAKTKSHVCSEFPNYSYFTKVKYNQETRLRLDSINPFLYNVSIGTDEVKYQYSAQNPLLDVFFPGWPTSLSPVITSDSSNIDPTFLLNRFSKQGIPIKLTDMPFTLDFLCEQATIKDNAMASAICEKIKAFDQQRDNLELLDQDLKTMYDNLKVSYLNLQKISNLNELLRIIAESNELRQEMQSESQKLISEKLKITSPNAILIADTLKMMADDFSSKYLGLSSQIAYRNLQVKIVTDIKNSAQELVDKFEVKDPDVFKQFKVIAGSILKGFSKSSIDFDLIKLAADTANNRIRKMDIEKSFIPSVVKLYNDIQNISFSVISAPLWPNADEYVYKVSIQPNPNLKYYSPRRSETFDLSVWVQGGFRANLSTGFGISSIYDSSYSILTDSIKATSIVHDSAYGTVTRTILPAASKTYTPGAVLMLHFYPRLAYRLNLNLNAGVLYDFNSKPQLLGGIGIIYGNRIRVAISAGCAAGYVNRLSSSFQMYRAYRGYELPDPLPIVKVADVGYFASLTFTASFTAIRELFNSNATNGTPPGPTSPAPAPSSTTPAATTTPSK